LLQQVEPQFTYFFVAFFYVYSMHLLNHFTDKASKLNDPVQTMFYGRHRRFLMVTGFLSALIALGLGAYLGLLPFIFILVMSGIGLMYSFKIIPERLARSTGIYRLKEIPGSKTMFTAVAWGVLAALIPVVCSDQEISGATAIAFFFVAGMIFIRSGLFEIMAIEGDRVVEIVEKPARPASRLAVTGCYFYDTRVFDMIGELEPSVRGELEITDVNNRYVSLGVMRHRVLDGWWTDAGTVTSLHRAADLVAAERDNPLLSGFAEAAVLAHHRDPHRGAAS